MSKKSNIITVPISSGELFDKISILEIKVSKGIKKASNELDLLLREKSKLVVPVYVTGFYKCLYAINLQLWDIEDKKRELEQVQSFGDEFVEYARSVYILNDERARLKNNIDKFMNSEISEIKQHRSY